MAPIMMPQSGTQVKTLSQAAFADAMGVPNAAGNLGPQST